MSVKVAFILLLLYPINKSMAFGFIFHPLKKLMRIHPREMYDQKKCVVRPRKMYGHFISSQVYPDEIHTFYVNEREPFNKKTIGQHLKPTTLRIIRIDLEHVLEAQPFKVHWVEACIPNEEFLQPSYEQEGLRASKIFR